MKKIVSVICLLMVCLLLVCSCTTTPPDTEEPTDDGEVTTAGEKDPDDTGELSMEEAMPTYPKITREMTILHIGEERVLDSSYNPHQNGDAIDIVNYEAMQYIGELYNVDIIRRWQPKAEEVLQIQHFGGDTDDVVTPHPTDGIVALMTQGILANLLEMDHLNLEADWWSQDQIKNFTTVGKLYVGVSDAAVWSQGINAFIYNKNLYEDLQFEDDVYKLVDDGKWTFEKLYEMISQSSSDTMGDESTKRFGLCMWENATTGWVYAMGERILDKNEDGSFSLGYNVDGLETVASQVLKLTVNQKDNILRGTEYNGTIAKSKIWQTFKEGRALFMNFDVSLYTMFYDLQDFKFGFLPTPKLNEEQDNYMAFTAAGFYAIPAAAENLEHSAIILEAYSVYSHYEMLPTYFNEILLGRLSEQPEDYRMLELIHKSKVYDLGYTLDEGGDARTFLATAMKTQNAKSAVVFLRQNESLLNSLVEFANTLEKG